MQENEPVVQNNRQHQRFEIEVEGQLAVVEYRLQDATITMTHTHVPTALEGRGIGSKLAKAALDAARQDGLTVVPRCPFIAGYIQRHPEYQALVKS